MRKLHYFAFSFRHEERVGNVSNTQTASAYIGYPNQLITIPRLKAAKKAAGIHDDAVLIGLGYMGHMTDEVVRGFSK